MPGKIAEARATRSQELLVALVCATSETTSEIDARRFYRNYRTRYSTYKGMTVALARLADKGYVEHTEHGGWILTAEGVHHTLQVLAQRYRKDRALLAA